MTIRDVKSRRLVTAIEILSPSNKAGSGRRQYLRKRRRLMARRVHLLEIDLIRAGRPVQRLPRRPVGTYFAYLSRYHHRGAVEVWGMPLTAMLPTVKVPLRRNEPDVPLNLQRVLTAAYDGGCYDLLIDYCREPPGPLAEEDAAWLDARLREAGRRS